MSTEWSFNCELVEEHLQIILADLEKEGKDPKQSADIVQDRLTAALQPPPYITLSTAYVNVTFSYNSATAKTEIFGTKHYQGTSSNVGWGGSSSGFMTMSKDGSVHYIANNRAASGRGGSLQIQFLAGSKECGYFSGADLQVPTSISTGNGTMWT